MRINFCFRFPVPDSAGNRESLPLWLCSSQLIPLREEGEQVVDDIGTFWIGGEMVLHKTEDAVGAASIEAVLVEGFGFCELAVAFIGWGGEVDAADGEMLQMHCSKF